MRVAIGKPDMMKPTVQALPLATRVPLHPVLPRLILAVTATLVALPPVAAADFGRDVLPLISDRCFRCHGPDAAQRQGGLRLDLRHEATATALSGNVPVEPGEPESSELLRRVSSEDSARRMPPVYSGYAPLTSDEIATLREWIRDGAEYTRHWSFSPPKQSPVPQTSNPSWTRQTLDSYVLARLDQSGLSPTEDVEAGTWLRRMMLDLTGLPPDPSQISAFRRSVSDRGEAAYEEAVNRALSSPRFGERMAMDWLDVARYADTHGFNNDSERSMWRWREWVIDAFNRNLSYDRFITEQLAGDLVEDPTLDQVLATGFNRNHVINSEGGIIDEEYRVEYVADRVRTVSMAWLGLTFECARCHDHKFDPISQRDYYRFFAFFDKVPEHGEAGRVSNAPPMISAPTLEQGERIAELKERVAQLAGAYADDRRAWRLSATSIDDVVVPAVPFQAEVAFRCEAQEGGPAGISGTVCDAREHKPDNPVKVEKHGAFTIALWMWADEEQSDAPLFSAIDYSPDPASQQHGTGVELRWIDGEVELRISRRFPSYSIGVRSVGASLGPGDWRHVAAVFEGSEGKDSLRMHAAWVRLFIDGREVATRILHDDVRTAVSFAKPYRIGFDNATPAIRFRGSIDEVAVWNRPLTDAEVGDLFDYDALPWSLANRDSGRAKEWLHRRLHSDSELVDVRRELFGLQRGLPSTMVMTDLPDRPMTRVLGRGRYDAPGEPVEPGVPEDLLGAWPDAAPANRLGLAEWLTRPDHPTTARVVVNRFWQQIFGTGLVKTSADFGVQGEAPSHPELLDRLATDFVRSGWDTKRLVRQIVLSSTYRQDAAAGSDLWRMDPENRLLGRGPRNRLPAEVIRDQALLAAGLLGGRIGGPSVYPYQPEGLYDGIIVGAAYPGTTWKEADGEDLYRRSLYTFWKRTLPHPAMTTLDAPDREFCTVQRAITNTPLQALTLMNDPTFVESARMLAGRAIRDGGEDPASRITYAFELVTGRRPDQMEGRILLQSLEKFRQSFTADPDAARALLDIGKSGADPDVESEELAAYAALASLLLNLDEVITKG